MRVFLSVYSNFTLAIPMDAVASMVLYKQKTEKLIQYDPGNRSTYVSLPWLFNMPDQAVPHGIVLRVMNSKVNKVVLLTAEVKRDIEIPDEEFYPIPKSLGALRFSAIFSGIKFSGNPVLLLNIEQLLQVIQNEQLVRNEKTYSPEQPLPTAPTEPSPPASNKVIEEPTIKESPIEEAPIEEPSIKEPPIEETPIEEAPVEEPPIEETPIEETPVEEPPKSPAIASEASSLTFDKILEICGVIKEPPIEKPPISPAEPPKPPSLALEPQPSPQGVEPEVRVSPLAEVLELCEITEETPISPVEASESFSLVLDEVLELCEITNEPPTSPAETSEASSLALEPQTSPQGVEPEVRVSPLAEVTEVIEVCEVCEVIEICEVTEVCEVIDEWSEVAAVPWEPPEPSSLALEPQTSPQGVEPEVRVSPLAEVLELCEI